MTRQAACGTDKLNSASFTRNEGLRMPSDSDSPEYRQKYGRREERDEQGLPRAGGGGGGSTGCALVVLLALGLPLAAVLHMFV
jgi:hypothetical protein